MKREVLLLLSVTACYPAEEASISVPVDCEAPACVADQPEAVAPPTDFGTPPGTANPTPPGPGPSTGATPPTEDPTPRAEGTIPARFTFADHAPALFSVSVAGPEGRPWPGADLVVRAGGDTQGDLHMGANGRRMASLRVPRATPEVALGTAITGVPAERRIPVQDAAVIADVGPVASVVVDRTFAECFAHTFPEDRPVTATPLLLGVGRLASRSDAPTRLQVLRRVPEVDLAYAVVEGDDEPTAWTRISADEVDVTFSETDRLVMAALDRGTGAVIATTAPRPAGHRDGLFVFDPPSSAVLATFEVEGIADLNDAVVRLVGGDLATDALPRLTPPMDLDADGVLDADDRFPEDPMRAGRLHFPGARTWGTRLFDTAWPDRGDADFNDVVLGYRVTRDTDASGATARLVLDLAVRAVGTDAAPGVAWRLPVSPDLVAEAQVVLPGRGARQAVAWDVEDFTTTLLDDAAAFMGETEGRLVNTEFDGERREAARIQLVVDFVLPVALPPHEPFDLFLFDPERSGWELHAVDVGPTSLETGWLGVSDDDSDADVGRYYRDAHHEGWVVDLASTVPYPAEGCTLDETYPRYREWVVSGGYAAQDWLRKPLAACALDLAR